MKNKSSMYKTKGLSIFYYLPMLIIAGFVPLIVYGKYINLEGTTQFLYWTGVKEMLDFFSYWKSRWVIVLTSISLFTYLVLLISKKTTLKKEYKYYIPLGIYALCVIVSTIFAIDVPTALNGFVDMYQGMWVLLSYAIITFLMINLINGEREIKWFLNAFIFLIIVEGLIGVGQYFGFDIFNTKFGNATIIPSGVTVEGGLTFNFGKHTIYGTLFNTNYVGSFATLMLPMAVAYLVLAKTKKTKIIGSIALVLCIFIWLGCNSRAGYVGVAFGCIIAVIMLRRYVVKYWKVSVCTLAVVLICFIGMNVVTDGKLVTRIKTLNVFSSIRDLKNQRYVRVKNISIDNNKVNIETNKRKISFIFKDNTVMFFDEDNNILHIDKNNRLVDSKDNYIGFNITNVTSYAGINISISTGRGWIPINFYFSNNGIKYIISYNKIVDFNYNAKFFKPLEGYETFMSSRGYIWGASIPLVLDRIVGYGPDNFIYAFPQDISIYKLNSLQNASEVTDKPHNMYLQISINNGIITFIAFLVVCFMYIILSIKSLWKKKFTDTLNSFSLMCLVAVASYLFTGIFNDQIVSVAPLFYIILGIGISLNSKLLKKDKDNVKNM